MRSQRSWWRLALAVEASAEWFTRSVRPPPGTELASLGKQHSPLSPTQRCTRASRGRGSSSTGRVGFARRSEVAACASVRKCHTKEQFAFSERPVEHHYRRHRGSR